MAGLFGKTKLRERAQQITTDEIAGCLQIVQLWHYDYHHGTLKKDKETSREQQYNQDFFVKVLGYEEKPASPYTLTPKDTTSSGNYPDAVLRCTNSASGVDNIFAVVELKGASVHLDKPQQGYGNLTPVQQAFKYKPQYKSCPFVVVSNFFEFRLYNNNQLDFERWTLDDLIDPADAYLKFKTWYVLMRANNFTAAAGPSTTQNLLSLVRHRQEEIGKEFYVKYKDARLALLQTITQTNAVLKADFNLAIAKAQTIVDRVVFACFAEDIGLLPDDIIALVVKQADESVIGETLFDAFKRLFKAIDTGNAKLEVPIGYNGGLFAFDPLIDDLEVPDGVMRQLADLSSYEFDEELPVNVLGHIFEQSISDLEDIRRKIREEANPLYVEPEPHPRTGVRHREGIYYTPDHIVHHIVDSTLGTYLRQKEEEIRAEHGLSRVRKEESYEQRQREAYVDYLNVLQTVKVLDPACGSGAFLVYVFDYLMKETQRVNEILGGSLASYDEFVRSILTDNIYGVDLNQESIEITKLSLWLKTAEKGKPLTALDNNIKCGNSLIDDVDVVGNKAFHWAAAFPGITKFDVVIGNPPYVDSESMVIYSPEERVWIAKNYEAAQGNWDLFVAFVEKGLELLADDPAARFGFIMPNKVLGADYASTLRTLIDSSYVLEEIADVSREKVFQDADVYPVILIIRRGSESDHSQKGQKNRHVTITRCVDPLLQENENFSSSFTKNWTEYLAAQRELLSVLAGADRLRDHLGVHDANTVSEAYDLVPCLTNSLVPKTGQLKFINTGTIDRYTNTWGKLLTRYIKVNYSAPLVAKRDAPQKPWLTSPRIVIAGMATIIEAFPDPEMAYFAGKSTVVVTTSDIDELFYATALLNSPVISAYLTSIHSSEAMAGGYINVKPNAVRDLPYIPYSPEDSRHVRLAELSRSLTELYEHKTGMVSSANKFLLDMYGAKPDRAGDLIALGFDKLRKRIRSIDVSTAAELHQWFSAQALERTALVQQIEDVEREVSNLVNECFGVAALMPSE
jgi:N-6 DNA Methylase/TaqI-like C-terminal specificity domain